MPDHGFIALYAAPALRSAEHSVRPVLGAGASRSALTARRQLQQAAEQRVTCWRIRRVPVQPDPGVPGCDGGPRPIHQAPAALVRVRVGPRQPWRCLYVGDADSSGNDLTATDETSGRGQQHHVLTVAVLSDVRREVKVGLSVELAAYLFICSAMRRSHSGARGVTTGQDSTESLRSSET